MEILRFFMLKIARYRKKLKFSKKPGDSFLIPISIVSVVAFILQITQITASNLLIDKSNIVLVIYIFPISFILIIILQERQDLVGYYGYI